MTKKCVKGVVLTLLIALSWVGTLHLLKLSFHNVQDITNLLVQKQKDALADSGEDSDDEFFNASESTVEPIPFAARPTPPDPGHPKAAEQPTANAAAAAAIDIPPVGRNVNFDAPFFTAWYCSMWNVLFLPIFSIVKLFSCFGDNETANTKNIFVESIHHLMEKGMTPVQFFVKCGFFCSLWMLTNYLLVFTLRTLDTTVVMALFSATVTLVYLLSWVFLHHQFVGIRIVAVIVCDTGIALLAYMDGSYSRTLGTVVLAAGAACGASIYKVFYQRMIGYEHVGEMSLFFTLIGFLNAFLMWPMVLLLYFTGAETIIWSHIPWLPLSGAAALNLLANLLSNFGLYWTYEVFLSLGILLAIPISAVVDASVYNVEFKDMKLGGISLLMIGFLVVLLPDNWNHYMAELLRKRLAKWKRNEQLKKNGARVQDTATAQLSRLRTPSGRVK